VTGAAVLGGITLAVLTLYIVGLSAEGNIVLRHFFCSQAVYSTPGGSHVGPLVCPPPSPWEWVFPFAGVVGAVASAIGTSMLLRHRTRWLDSSSPPLVPTTSH
jgi:hypothetical protein